MPDEELARCTPNEATVAGFTDHVLQADTGADLDFLRGSSGSRVCRESH